MGGNGKNVCQSNIMNELENNRKAPIKIDCHLRESK